MNRKPNDQRRQLPDCRPEGLQDRWKGSAIYPNKSNQRQDDRRQKATSEIIKKAEFKFMLDLNTLIAKSPTDPELNRFRGAMRRGEKDTTPELY